MLKIIYDNIFDSSTISASPPAKTDLNNTKNVYREKVAKFDSKIVSIYGTMTKHEEISGIAICRHNMTADGTCRIKLYDWSNLIYDSGKKKIDEPLSFNNRIFGANELGISPFYYASSKNFYFDFSLIAANRFEIILDDSNRIDDCMMISRIFLGKSIGFGVDYNFGVSYIDTSPQIRTKSGSLLSGSEAIYRKLNLSFPSLNREQRNELSQIIVNNGKRKEIFLKLFDTDNSDLRRDYSALYKITNDVNILYPYFEEWTAGIELSEC